MTLERSKNEEGAPRSGLRRTLGLPMLTTYAVGLIIGAGVYSVLGAAALEAGGGLWLAFLAAVVPAFLTSLSYAELATTFPKAGAEYVYVVKATGRRGFLAFVTGIVLVFAGTATAATVSLAFAGYLRQVLDLPAGWVAAGLLAVLTGVSISGIRNSGWMNATFTIIEIVGLLIVVFVATGSGTFARGALQTTAPGLLGGAALLFFVYLGFENVANLTEEAKDPARDVPRALFISVGLTAVLYVLVALAAVGLVGPEALGRSEAPLATAVEQRWSLGGRLLTAAALFATANTALVSLIVAARLLYGMANDGVLPRKVAETLPKRRTPWLASLLVLGVALFLLPLGEVAVVASVSSFASLLAFAVVNVAVVALRVNSPEIERPWRVPLTVGRVPVPPLLAVASIALLATQFETVVYLAGGLAILVAVALWLARLLLTQSSAEKV